MTTASVLSCTTCQGLLGPDDHFCEACGEDTLRRGLPASGLRVGNDDGGGAGCAACEGVFGGTRPEYCLGCGTRQPAGRDHVEAHLPGLAAVSDRGRRHRRNEDAFAIARAPDGRILAVVCDGVSTTARPDEASRAAADAALAAMLAPAGPNGDGDLDTAYLAARLAVHQIPREAEERTGAPSCTFLAAAVNGGNVRVASMGDSRAFWIPEAGEPQILTVDDSWAAEQVREKSMTAEAARRDARSHSITRWLGGDAEPEWRPHRVGFRAAGRGRLVLCSDGLWNYADGAADLASVLPAGDALTVAGALVEWANAQGGHDNVTVVILDVGHPVDGGHAQQRGPAR